MILYKFILTLKENFDKKIIYALILIQKENHNLIIQKNLNLKFFLQSYFRIKNKRRVNFL